MNMRDTTQFRIPAKQEAEDKKSPVVEFFSDYMKYLLDSVFIFRH